MRIFSSPTRRTGFTLVELMVAVTLIIFIMTVLTEAFKAGIDSFRQLKAAGDLAERLRSAANVIRRDLASPHFESAGPDPTLRQYVRDQRLDRPGWIPPDRGFFRIWQTLEPNSTVQRVTIPEGPDSEGLTFSRATRHVLHFTAKYEGDDPGEYFSGLAPFNHTSETNQTLFPYLRNNIDLAAFSDSPTNPSYRYASRWAEVAMFLVPTGVNATATDGTAGPALHSLHRRIRVIPRTPTNPTPQFRVDMGNQVAFDRDHDVSFSKNQVTGTNVDANPASYYYYNNLQMVTDPRVRMDADASGGYPLMTNPDGTTANRPQTLGELRRTSTDNNIRQTEGDDILLNDVISFEVKVWWARHAPTAAPDPVMNIPLPSTLLPADSDFPFRELPPFTPLAGQAHRNNYYRGQQARVFDTGISDQLLQGIFTRSGLPFPAGGPALDPDRPGDTQTLPNPPTRIGYLSTNTTYQGLNLQVPLRIHVKALQIKLRVWDVKTKTTRQVTIVQEV